ncbi:MAG: extracellular solute-binding protein, partial [Actinomycetota bacterium]|nr:extracellular solute-binding protein [Actinomycetota bacterium]
VYGDNGYDSLNMFAETAIWCYGGDLGDFNTMQVKGIINGEGSIAGIEAYRKLFLCTPPGHGTAFYEENNNVYLSGLVPMVFNYTSTLPALTNKETNPYAENTGFFMTPPGKGPDGKTYQGTSLGGQGANIVKYSKNQDIAIEWLKWWCLDETQKLYSTYPGCFNGSYAIIEDPDFATASPLNQIAMDSCAILKDWWNVPEYAQTVRSFADTVGKYVIGGEGTAKEALDKVAEEWNQVFEEAGYYK